MMFTACHHVQMCFGHDKASFLLEQLPGRNIPSAAPRHAGLAHHMSQALFGCLLVPIVLLWEFPALLLSGKLFAGGMNNLAANETSRKHQNSLPLSWTHARVC